MRRKVTCRMMAALLAATLLGACREEETRGNPELLREALAAADRGGWQEARTLSYRATQQNPGDVNALTTLALMLAQHGQYDQALTQLNRAVELDPSHFAAQYNRGRILFENNHLQDCPMPLEKALALRPEHVETRLLLARAYAALGNHRDAISHYAVLARDPRFAKGGEIYNEIGVLQATAGDYAKAAQFLTIAWRHAPTSPEINYNLAALCDAHLGKPVQAIELYRRYLQLTESNPAIAVHREKITARINALGGN